MTSRPAADYEAAALQVSYELISMVDMALRLHLRPTDGTVHNALLEGVLLHSRNLIDFLGPWKHQQDDIKPSDFVAGWDSSLQVSGAERTAIHKHLAHLTWTRVDERKVAWEFPGIAAKVFEAMGRFVAHCEAKDAPQAGTFRVNYELALATMKSIVPAANDVDLTTASNDSPLVLDDFRDNAPPPGEEADC